MILIPFSLSSQTTSLLTNHIGYENSKAKRAIILADKQISNKQRTSHSAGTVVIRHGKVTRSVFVPAVVYQLKISSSGSLLFVANDE